MIEVDDASSFAAPLVWAATTTPSQLATNSLPNGTLFWRVRAFNSDGVGGPYSAVRTVQVREHRAAAVRRRSPAPSLLSPASDARFSPGQSITFDWSDVAGAASYTIQIDDSQSFSAPLSVTQTVAASQFTDELAAHDADVVARARERRLGRRREPGRRRGGSR